MKKNNKNFSTEVENVQLKIAQLRFEIERERAETIEETSAILQELLDEKDILEQQLLELQTNLLLSDSFHILSDDTYRTFMLDIDGQVKKISIVPLAEVNPIQGKISLESPLARALVGRNENDLVEVETPSGLKNYRVIAIR